MKKEEKKEWDRIAQGFYECWEKALCALKREKYISLKDYEKINQYLYESIKEPKD